MRKSFLVNNLKGPAATSDIAAFRKDRIAAVKKSVNHSKTVTSMREMRRIRAILSEATRRKQLSKKLMFWYSYEEVAQKLHPNHSKFYSFSCRIKKEKTEFKQIIIDSDKTKEEGLSMRFLLS